MKFDREKSFGYPTLRTFLEGDDLNLLDYPNKTFDPDIKVILNANEKDRLDLEYQVGLRVKALSDLVSEKKAKYHFQVECPSTFYCQSFSTFGDEGIIELAGSELKQQIVITPFIIAETDLVLFSKEIHSDFGNESFEVIRGSVLAVGRPTDYYISREQFRSVRSIFELYPSDSVEPGDFRIRTDEQYVGIEMERSLYEKVRIAEQDKARRIFLLSSLYVPVIMYLLYALIEDQALAENKRWASTIVGKASQKGLNIYDANLVATNAQKLLDMPFAKVAQNGFQR